MVLTNLFRQMDPPWYAPLRLARNPLDSSSAVTTAASAVASSVLSTHGTKSASTSLRVSIPRANGTAPATVVTVRSASGSISVPAELTARAPTVAARPQSPSRRLPLQSGQTLPAWAAWHKASKGPGTGALSKHLGVATGLGLFGLCTRWFSSHVIPSLDDIRMITMASASVMPPFWASQQSPCITFA